MKLPCETIAQIVLPKLRASIAKILSTQELSQKQIAGYLGVSQPVVSGYLKQDEDLPLEYKALVPILKELTSSYLSYSRNTKTLESNSVHFLSDICYICKNTRISGPMCTIHKQQQQGLPDDCNICITSEKIRSVKEEKVRLKTQLQNAAQKIFSLPDSYEYIPEIGSQFAVLYVKGKQVTENDVISFPGRIIRYKNQAKIVASPNFGESDFSSKILLHLYNSGQNKRCLLILKNKDLLRAKIANIKQQRGLNVLNTQAFDENWLEILESSKIKDIDIIFDKGAPGYESLAYFFTGTLKKMIKLVKRL